MNPAGITSLESQLIVFQLIAVFYSSKIESMKKILTTALALSMTLAMTAADSATKTVRLKVIETSDVHGHFFPWDFMEGKPIKGTLARANTYINRQRQEFGERLLLIDNGDILQGQPCIYWSNYVMPDDPNLAAQVVNYMKWCRATRQKHTAKQIVRVLAREKKQKRTKRIKKNSCFSP